MEFRDMKLRCLELAATMPNARDSEQVLIIAQKFENYINGIISMTVGAGGGGGGGAGLRGLAAGC